MNVFVWLAIMVILLVTEACTTNLITIWFAGGALCGALAAYLGAGTVPQLLVFLIVSLVLLAFTRPLAVKFMKKSKTKTNVDSLIGRVATVTEEINNLAQTGHARIGDIDWMARAEEDTLVIPAGTIVVVREVKGVRLIVKEREEFK